MVTQHNEELQNSPNITRVIKSRRVRVAVSRACPQGGVLSPLLWCLVVDDLIARLSMGGVYSQDYADDIYLLAVGKFPNTVSELMQRALHTVEKWCGRVGLSLNPDKTDLVVFTRKRKLSGFFEPLFFGVLCTVPSQSSICGWSWTLG
jgi:hypothetical protein